MRRSLEIIHIGVETGEDKKVRHLQLVQLSILIRYDNYKLFFWMILMS